MAERFGLIYVLYHPITGEVRYCGLTTMTLRKRLRGHEKKAQVASSKSHVTCWIRSLQKQGLAPGICPWDQAQNREDLDRREVQWIALFREQGFRLTNHLRGGGSERPATSKKRGPLSQEHRDKISAARTGVKLTAEHRASISRGGKGRVFSPEHKAKIGAANKGRTVSKELSAKIRAALATLTEEEVYQIKDLLHHKTMQQSKIANIYDVSRPAITLIKRGKRWAHVQYP